MKKPIKAARILADLTQHELCKRADIPLITLRRLEGRPSHKGLVSEETEASVVSALEKAGVDFIPENGGGHGVRLRKRSNAE
jgi:hypothetical protein